MTARILAGLVGLLLALSAVGWVLDPSSAAGGLGMPLLDGIGRSTQIGDFSSFFVTGALLCLYGAYKQEAPWLIAAAMLLGFAAVFRTVAWLVHGADFAVVPIAVEVASTVILVVAAMLVARAHKAPA